MKFDIWGAEESWLVNYLNQRAALKIEPTENDLKAFESLRAQNDKTPRILKIVGDTAEIQINGSLSQDGPDFLDFILGEGGTSYNDIIAAVDIIENDSVIKNLNILMNTPGGEMIGLDNTWKKLFALRKSKKIIAVNNGFLASAGYYLASAASEIFSSSETNEIGSIGVMISGVTFTGNLKKWVVLSKNAPDKNSDGSTEEGEKILQERVDTFERFFLKRISAGRGLEIDFIAKNFGRGGLLVSKNPEEGKADALSVKMIDKVLNISTETGASSAPVQFNAKQEEQKMNLMEFLAANPGAKVEFDQQMKIKYDAGMTEGKKTGKEEVEAKIQKTFAFLKEETVYPPYIQSLALTVAKGEKSVEALEAVVAVYDMEQEKIKAEEAKKESGKTGETAGEHKTKQEDGKVRDEESMKAALDKAKKFI